ncbi:EamA family transporter [Vibrio sp. 10N.286.46.A8]|uniref:EamA family transporter n=1 Tax=Vibrio sp. 10N.286.46.A8 TaxID=3229697 RepID=UPI003551622E
MLIGYFFVLLAIVSTSSGIVFYKIFTKSRNKVSLLATVILMVCAPIFSFTALKYLSIDLVYMATSLNGLVVLLMSRFVLGEDVKRNQLLGSILVFIGVFIYMV